MDQSIKEVRNFYKKLYQKPDINKIPYHINMVRPFKSINLDSPSRHVNSIISRDCENFVNELVHQVKNELEQELYVAVKQLHTKEKEYNEDLMKKGFQPVDWKFMWND